MDADISSTETKDSQSPLLYYLPRNYKQTKGVGGTNGHFYLRFPRRKDRNDTHMLGVIFFVDSKKDQIPVHQTHVTHPPLNVDICKCALE